MRVLREVTVSWHDLAGRPAREGRVEAACQGAGGSDLAAGPAAPLSPSSPSSVASDDEGDSFSN